MPVSPDEVRRIARLARLRLEPGDEARLADELGRVLDYMALLAEVDVSGVPPTTHGAPMGLPGAAGGGGLRPDEPEQRLGRDAVLEAAPDADGGYVRVPRVVPAADASDPSPQP